MVDAVGRYAREFLTRAIKANGLYEQKYPMVSGLARPCIVEEVVAVAREVGADTVAHGCTGKGNDQVRFEVGFYVLAPDLKVLAPIRDADIPREKADRPRRGVGDPHRERRHDLLGRREPVGPHRGVRAARGPLGGPARGRVRAHRLARRAAGGARRDRRHVRARLPVALDGAAASLPEIVRALDALGGSYGFGRVDMIENRRVGIKSRELYEVPGALAIIRAHQALEDLTLEREVAHHKPLLEQRWADLVYDGQWFSPLRQAIDAYVDATQSHVTGEVRLRFEPGSCIVVGRRSDHSSTISVWRPTGAEDAFDQSDAEGYVRLYGMPLKVWSAKQGTGAR